MKILYFFTKTNLEDEQINAERVQKHKFKVCNL